MFHLTSSGSFENTLRFLKNAKEAKFLDFLHKYGQDGVAALAAATPVDSGITASSWSYTITTGNKQATLQFTNDNINKGVPIAIILQYGHGTGTGGYVVGRDYINPAIQPVFDKISEQLTREVNNL